MRGPHQSFPLTQREWHEQAAAIAYQPPPAPTPWAGTPQAAPNPFIPNPLLVKEDSDR